MKKLCFAWLLLTLVSAACTRGVGEGSGKGRLTLMTWNVHNLFDGNDDGFEYGEFLQSSGWSQEKYLGRLNGISAAIGKIDPGPDIIVFQELESQKVLEDLAISLNSGYLWNHFANNYGAAVGLGIISRLPLVDGRTHSVTVGADTPPRPVLEARIQTAEGEIVVFACHWKSKIGGDNATESVRRASARLILRRIRELWENEPELGIIAAGDLNENYDEFYRRGSNVICALIPDDPDCAALAERYGAQTDFIVIGNNKPPEPVYFPEDYIVLFSPWTDDLENGSYYYKNNWETIDHFLISRQFFDNSGWEYERAFTAAFEPFANYNGTPIAYNARTGSGFSDHFPLLITLRQAAE